MDNPLLSDSFKEDDMEIDWEEEEFEPEEGVEVTYPLRLSGLPEEILQEVTCFLDVHSLAGMRLVSHSLKLLSERNEAGWTALTERLWKDKIFVSQEARLLESHHDAYRVSLLDARHRSHILREELCFNPVTGRGTIWSFRFKQSAGPDWTEGDPWYRGEPARQMVFLENGQIKQYKPRSQKPSYVNPSNEDATLTPVHFDLLDPPLEMTWRFVGRPLDLPRRQLGAYLRLKVGSREVPTYMVRRSPTHNWGFIMESCWGLYVSFPLPKRRVRVGRVRRAPVWQQGGGRHVQVVHVVESEDELDDDDDEDTTTTRRRRQSANERSIFNDDSYMMINNQVQWREALLYNFGARLLPEGEGAADDFDASWNSHQNDTTNTTTTSARIRSGGNNNGMETGT